MRRSMLIALLSLVVAGPAAGTARDTGSSTAGKARVHVESTRPVEVIGAGFKSRERVQLTFAATRVWKKTLRATRTGRFDVVFAAARAGRCNGYTVIARGEGGSVASQKVMPLCPPIGAPPAG